LLTPVEQAGDFYGFDYTRDQAFSYKCNRCKRCCYAKRIPLNPYDLIRLSEALGKPTAEVIERFTEGGVALTADADREGSPCVFLGPEGCTVHPGRPGACRIYPLGRISKMSGEERFAFVEPHPETEGEYGELGTIANYLAQQDLAPYFEASAAYLKLFHQIAKAGIFDAGDAEDGPLEMSDLLDVDAVVAAYCAEQNLPVPSDADSKMRIHIAAIEAMIPESE
jgi:hypothetical protein